MPQDESASIESSGRKPYGVMAASITQALIAAVAIVSVYAAFFAAMGVWQTNSGSDWLIAAGFVLLIGGPIALVAGVVAGVVAGLIICRRRDTWSPTRLRWTVAGAALVISALGAVLLVPFYLLIAPLPFIAAGIAAWRLPDLADGRRASNGWRVGMRDRWPTKTPPTVKPKSRPDFPQ